MMKIELKL